jgi:hypothetical protein
VPNLIESHLPIVDGDGLRGVYGDEQRACGSDDDG